MTKLKPGIYRGRSSAEFGLWRLRPNGQWLFCTPVSGAIWRYTEVTAEDEAKLISLVDAPAGDDYEYRCVLIEENTGIETPTLSWSGPRAASLAREHHAYCHDGRIQRRSGAWEDVT